jgi:hypothetical protein
MFSSRQSIKAARAKKRAHMRAARADGRYVETAQERKQRRTNKNDLKQFVAVDSEGFSFGAPVQHNAKTFRPHKTFLWGAGDETGRCAWLQRETGRDPQLHSAHILDWLLRLPDKFPNAIFVGFSISYDVTQILSDLPFEKVWEIQKQKPFPREISRTVADIIDGRLVSRTETETINSGAHRRITFWRDFGISYLKGKRLTLYKMRDADAPYKTVVVKQAGVPVEVRKLDYVSRIEIFDVFGFFQASFIQAAKGMSGAILPDELERIAAGKSGRATFQPSDIADVKEYTRTELVVLSRMMRLLREGLIAKDLHLRAWQGAGSIAAAMMKQHKVRDHFDEVRVRDLHETQVWAHHAYFGGRIELMRQGFTTRKLFSYDVASAYPAVSLTLPSMQAGEWRRYETVTAKQLASFSVLSIVEISLDASVLRESPPFFPLPYRTPQGAILFPRKARGYYMADEAKAALEWQAVFSPECDCVKLCSAWEFVVRSDVKPFAFISDIFEERRQLAKTDIVQIVLKLGMNSCYGKLAQAVAGGVNSDKPPSTACPWYAAAITAGTRAQLLRAALHDPNAIVMFATDGIISTRPLPLHIPATKTLGAWEGAEIPHGGLFVQSGVYALGEEKGFSVKSRGFRPNDLPAHIKSLGDYLVSEIPARWREGVEKEFRFDYTIYLTIGAALASRETFAFVGQWANGTRALDLDKCGNKRDVQLSRKRRRAHELLPTLPSWRSEFCLDDDGELLLSAASVPDWLDVDFGLAALAERETQDIVSARFAID